MPQPHVAERQLVNQIAGSFRFAQDMGILVDGDLTSADAAKTAVRANVAKLHVSERLAGRAVEAAIDAVDNFLTGATTGSSIANVIALAPNSRSKMR